MQAWVIRTKKKVEWTYSMHLDGHALYTKGDNPDHSGILFETEKQAHKSLSRYDSRYRDDYEIAPITIEWA